MQIMYWLLGGMVAFALLLILLAMLVVSITGDDEADPLARQVLAERVQPWGRVNTGEPGTMAEAGPTEVAELSGEQIYRNNCAACHDSGAMQAPLTDDAGTWNNRLDQGRETLVRHAIEGIGQMPARGGNPNLSDDEVAKSVDYMLERLGR